MKVTLRTADVTDADELYTVIDTNREHLTNLVWSASATQLSTEKYLASVPKNDILKVILLDDKIVGMITLRKKDYRTWSIGYWLAYAVRRQGIMTRAVKLILTEIPKNHFVEAHVRKNNIASQNVLSASGFAYDFVDISNDGNEYFGIWVYKSNRSFFGRLFNIFK